jgi:hypothetical protein
MTPEQRFIAVTLVLLVLGRLVQAITTRHGVGEALANFGLPAVLAAAAGGLNLLIAKAGVLQDVSSIGGGELVSGGERLGAGEVADFGDQLLVDDIYVYIVFAILVGLILYEIKVASPRRETAPVRATAYLGYIGLGYLLPNLFGASALYLIYIRS